MCVRYINRVEKKIMLEIEKVVRGIDGKNFSMCILYDCVYNLVSIINWVWVTWEGEICLYIIGCSES